MRLHSERLRAVLTIVEPLWVASLVVQMLLLGPFLAERGLHLLGRGGLRETVEWATYMSLLFIFPLLAGVLGDWRIRRDLTEGAHAGVRQSIRRLLLVVLAFEAVYFVVRTDWRMVVLAVMLSLVCLVLASRTGLLDTSKENRIVFAAAAVLSWVAAGRLVVWSDPGAWLTEDVVRVVVLLAGTALAMWAIRRFAPATTESPPALRIADTIACIALAAFSFRTNPIVEFYHWGFYIGPVEQVRQGGTLLWDTPSQYGFLSVLLPAALPFSSWQALWLVQALAYVVAAILMYGALRRLFEGWSGVIVAAVVTFATLFFRPRTASLLLPAQMTPSGGPVRFVWCFMLLAVAVLLSREDDRRASARIAAGGWAVWIIALLWSVESATYASAIWFPAVTLNHFIQRAESTGRGGPGRLAGAALHTLSRAVVFMLVLAVTLGSWYMVTQTPGPDWSGYTEYARLYGRGGWAALPIESDGAVWYLVLAFVAVSSAFASQARLDWKHRNLIALASAWGAVWGLSSYFVARSHPVNVLSIAPLVIVAIATAASAAVAATEQRWRTPIFALAVPAIILPASLTISHDGLPANMTTPQVEPSRIVEQVPTMEPSLFRLFQFAGVSPLHSVVRIADGRLILPAWPRRDSSRTPAMSSRSWLPKPYEVIGTLPPERREVYIARMSRRPDNSGWLAHSVSDTIPGFTALQSQLEKYFFRGRVLRNEEWTLIQYRACRRGCDRRDDR